MRTESMELTGTHEPRVYTSGGDLPDEDDYINAAVDTVVYLRAAPSGPQKKNRTPSIMRSLSPVVICWVILLMITGLRIHYTSVISVKLKDFEDIKHRLQVPEWPENLSKEILQLTEDNKYLSETNQKLTAEIKILRANLLNQKEETSKKREPRFDWTTTPMPEARRYYNTRPHPHYDRPHYYYTTQQPYYNRPPSYYTTPRPYNNRRRYQYTTHHPSYNRPWNYNPTPFPYYNTPLYYYTTPPPYYYKLYYSQSSPSYFYRRKKRQTEPCPQGWLHFQSSCYMISGWNYSDEKTWDEARDDCRFRGADLVVVGSPEEQDFIYKSSLTGAGTSGYWIGLRVKGSGWKWVNESDLKNSYWLQLPAEKVNCATSVKEANGWKSVSCDEKNGWICQQMAVSS
ncbi:uncharacterized protein V3H82_016508 [Fundulus diaphanus]